MEADVERRELAAIVVEAKHLLDDQRRALQRADFFDLLAIASQFHRLASRLGSLSPENLLITSDTEVQDVRKQIARQQRILEMMQAASTPPTRVYSRFPTAQSGASLLLDHYS